MVLRIQGTTEICARIPVQLRWSDSLTTPTETPGISLTTGLTYLVNIPLIFGVAAVLTVFLVEKSRSLHTAATASHSLNPTLQPTSNQQLPLPLASKAPSIYDVFRAVQFFITTALLSLVCLERRQDFDFSYRWVASKLEWMSGMPPRSFKLGFIAANERIRRNICQVTYPEYIYSEYYNIRPPSSGFTDFGIGFRGFDLFFMVLLMFCCAMAAVIALALFLGIVAGLLCCLWEKWPVLKTAAHNSHFFVLGELLI
jgi:hypothetical protein